MSGGEMIGRVLELLPAGFGFRPTDEELVDHYLKLKILGMDSQVDIIPEVDVWKWEPWELPAFSVLQTEDPEWFFFSPLHDEYSNGRQFTRATEAGYWKPTGRDRQIKRGATEEVIGTKKTWVFYQGRDRVAVRTNWVMNMYRLAIASLPVTRAYVLCRLQRKTDENTGSDISTPDEAVSGGFSPEINFNGLLSELSIIQETWLMMNMEVGNSSTGSGIYQNGAANIMTLGATPMVRLSICPQTPLKGAYGEGGGSRSNTDTQVPVPLVEVKICNGKGSFNFQGTASASHRPSSSPPYLVKSLVGILLLLILIALMVYLQDIHANVFKALTFAWS